MKSTPVLSRSSSSNSGFPGKRFLLNTKNTAKTESVRVAQPNKIQHCMSMLVKFQYHLYYVLSQFKIFNFQGALSYSERAP